MSMDDVSNRVNTFGKARQVTIQDSVWIGSSCTLLPGVTIGKGSVIRAGSIVADDIPEMVLAGGNPATVLKEFK